MPGAPRVALLSPQTPCPSVSVAPRISDLSHVSPSSLAASLLTLPPRRETGCAASGHVPGRLSAADCQCPSHRLDCGDAHARTLTTRAQVLVLFACVDNQGSWRLPLGDTTCKTLPFLTVSFPSAPS